MFLALGREEEEYMYIGTKCLRYNFNFCIVESASRVQRTPVILCVYPRVARPSNRGSDETGVQQVVWIIAKRACVTKNLNIWPTFMQFELSFFMYWVVFFSDLKENLWCYHHMNMSIVMVFSTCVQCKSFFFNKKCILSVCEISEMHKFCHGRTNVLL